MITNDCVLFRKKKSYFILFFFLCFLSDFFLFFFLSCDRCFVLCRFPAFDDFDESESESLLDEVFELELLLSELSDDEGSDELKRERKITLFLGVEDNDGKYGLTCHAFYACSSSFFYLFSSFFYPVPFLSVFVLNVATIHVPSEVILVFAVQSMVSNSQFPNHYLYCLHLIKSLYSDQPKNDQNMFFRNHFFLKE